MSDFFSITSRLSQPDFTRVVAFGSSNTERRLPGMHWFDCFELACRTTQGPHFACINSGRGGDTTRDLLARFDRDCLAFRPGIVFLTVGGNDANAMPVEEYRRNLETIIEKLHALGSAVALQTYYAMDVAHLAPEYAAKFFSNMESVRAVSGSTGCQLIDHLARWEPLRLHEYAVYERLMADPMHVNEQGNLIMGVDIARVLGLTLPKSAYFREALAAQALLDRLAG